MLTLLMEKCTQFLPQDMVVEFARMDSYELLLATMKAMGDSKLEQKHEVLIGVRKQIKESTAVRLPNF